MQITNSHLLIKAFHKFSDFNFAEYGIGRDNYDYVLDFNNFDEIPYIIDPLTGNNVAKGKCRGINIREIFIKGYNLLYLDNYQIFINCRFFNFNQSLNISLIDLFKFGSQPR